MNKQQIGNIAVSGSKDWGGQDEQKTFPVKKCWTTMKCKALVAAILFFCGSDTFLWQRQWPKTMGWTKTKTSTTGLGSGLTTTTHVRFFGRPAMSEKCYSSERRYMKSQQSINIYKTTTLSHHMRHTVKKINFLKSSLAAIFSFFDPHSLLCNFSPVPLKRHSFYFWEPPWL